MIDFYTWAAPNGRRVAIMLEECGSPYRAVPVNLASGEQLQRPFLDINPAGAIPVIVDHDVAKGPLVLSQSSAILIYLARKHGCLLPRDAIGEAKCMEALMLGMTDIASAAVSRFLLTRLATPSPGADALFLTRLRNFLSVANARLRDSEFLAGDYSIADIALYPLTTLPVVEAAISDQEGYEHLLAWRQQVGSRRAVSAGMQVPRI